MVYALFAYQRLCIIAHIVMLLKLITHTSEPSYHGNVKFNDMNLYEASERGAFRRFAGVRDKLRVNEITYSNLAHPLHSQSGYDTYLWRTLDTNAVKSLKCMLPLPQCCAASQH